MEKNVSIENYKPDFAVEVAYDLTVADLKKQGIKAVLVDLDNTLIAWNNPDGTPEMRQWLHDLRDGGIHSGSSSGGYSFDFGQAFGRA